MKPNTYKMNIIFVYLQLQATVRFCVYFYVRFRTEQAFTEWVEIGDTAFYTIYMTEIWITVGLFLFLFYENQETSEPERDELSIDEEEMNRGQTVVFKDESVVKVKNDNIKSQLIRQEDDGVSSTGTLSEAEFDQRQIDQRVERQDRMFAGDDAASDYDDGFVNIRKVDMLNRIRQGQSSEHKHIYTPMGCLNNTSAMLEKIQVSIKMRASHQLAIAKFDDSEDSSGSARRYTVNL